MKKFFISLLIFIIACSFCCCDLFSLGNTYSYEKVTINYYNSTETVELYTGDIPKINPKYYEGKILMGFYDTKDDSGKMYFDFAGRSTTQDKWFSKNPHILYAVYEDISYSKTYTSFISRNENPYLFGYYVYGYRTLASFYDLSYSNNNTKKNNNMYTANDAYFSALLTSNPNLKLKLTMFFSLKEHKENTNCNFKYKIRIGSESFDDHVNTIPSSWTQFSASIEVTGKRLTSQNTISLLCVPVKSYDALLKNAYYTLSIIKP